MTGVGYGNAVITCTAADDEYIFAEASVQVVLPVTKVSLDAAEATLLLAERDPAAANTTLNYSVGPENAYIQDVMWSSSNEDVAIVDENGRVSAVAPGTATITAVSKDDQPVPPSCGTRRDSRGIAAPGAPAFPNEAAGIWHRPLPLPCP